MKNARRIICALMALVFVFGLVPMDAKVAAAEAGQLGAAVIEGNRDFKWPVPDYHNISACFFDDREHYSIDIGTMTTNADIVASYDGEVVEITRNGAGDYGYGNAVMLRHTYTTSEGTITLYTRYAHMDEISEALSVGTAVVGGETVLGKTGGTGYGSASYYADHLDFQILTSSDWLNRQTCSIDPFANNLLELPADLYLGRASDCCQSYIDAIKALYASNSHTHSYEKTVTAPTCTEDGYTTYVCSCGDEYTGDEVTALGHSWQEGICGADKICSVCSATEGTIEHKEVNGACSICGAISVSETNFPDANFRRYVSKNINGASDGWLTEKELKPVTVIYVGERGISSLKGIEFFSSLVSLICEENSLTELDVSKNTKLEALDCDFNNLTELDISNNTELESLVCNENDLTTLDLSKNSKLGTLNCEENELTELDLSGCPELQKLNCSSNKLTELDLSVCPKVRDLECTNNKLTTLDVSVCRELLILKCSKNQLVSLNTSGCTSLDTIDCSNNALTSLDLSTNTLIRKLNVQDNTRVVTAEGNKFDLSTLPGFDVSKVVEVVGGTLEGNILTAEDAVVEYYYDCGNDVTESFVLVMENLCQHNWSEASCTEARKCSICGLLDGEALDHNYDETTVTPPTCTEDGYTTYTCSCGDSYVDDRVSALGHKFGEYGESPTCSVCGESVCGSEHNEENGDCIICGAISVSEENFPDAAFREYVSNNFIASSDGWLTKDELSEVTSINTGNKGISSYKGIEYFTALKYFHCNGNENLTSLDLSKNTELNTLHCEGTSLTTLDLSKNTKLQYLYCYNSRLTSINLSKNTELHSLDCSGTLLTALDLSKNTKLSYLTCNNSQLTSLNLSGCNQLETIQCYGNFLTSLDLSGKTHLSYVNCNNNMLTSLNLRGCSWVQGVYCKSNQLTSIIFDGCTELRTIDCEDNLLTELNVKPCVNLSSLNCNSNYLQNLDVRSNTKLSDLRCEDNYLTSLDLSKCTALWVLWCTLNELESLDLSKNTELRTLYCGYNYLTSLDLSNCLKLSYLDPQYNIRVVTADQNKFDLSTLPNFDVSKVVEVVGGTIDGNILTAEEMAVGYYYDCGLGVAIGFVLVFENLCEHQWIEASCTEDKICYICGANGGEALGHDMGDWVTTDEPTCTENGSKRKDCSRCDHFETDVIPATGHSHEATITPPTCSEDGYTTYTCSCGDTYTDDEVDALGHDMSDWVTTDEPTCTVDGSKRKDCSRCDHFETEVIPAAHDMGDWYTVTEATLEADGEDRRDCSRCEHFETRITRFVDNMLKLEGEDFLNKTTVYINGLPYPVVASGDERYVELPTEEDCSIVTYDFHVGDPDDVHTQYPVGMKVYIVSDGEITYVEELDNLLQYSGSSIRITGKKGIRMITSLYKNTKSALTGKGLAGYKLVEYGTVLAFAHEVEGDGDLVLGKSYSRSNYAYKRGVSDPVYANKGDLTQYTNVLVGFNLDQCKEDLAMRPYIILENAEGEQFTIYGGTIYRSIGYVAYQNRNAVKPGTEAYKFVWEIIHHVYGDQYDSDYKG